MTERLVAPHDSVPFTFRIQVSHQSQEYPPNSSRLNREYSRAPRGAVISRSMSGLADQPRNTPSPGDYVRSREPFYHPVVSSGLRTGRLGPCEQDGCTDYQGGS